MKLLPLACFTASAAQSGDYDYGAVEEDRHYGYNSYGNYDDYGNKNSNTWTFGGKAVGSHQSIAVALNCWPANFDSDTLMMRDAAEANPSENHTYGPLHVYGSEMHSRLADLGAGASFSSEDPGLRSGMGGHYHYGHAHSDSTPNDTPSEWVHYHSARHAGCLYEVNDFTYNSGSWNRIFHMWYFNGYYDRTTESNQVDANLDGVTYDPNWVHFFNAHVLPSTGVGESTNPDGGHNSGNSIKLVMANPQYEGLGWLNFVATYARRGVAVGAAYQEFADSTHVTTTGNVGFDTYTQINSVGVQQTAGTTGNYYYDAWMGTWEMNMDDSDNWETGYDESSSFSITTGAGCSLSSFPHNEQGKDFRFNMRILLRDDNATTRKSYYFYKINTITVQFPEPVAYALVYDGRESNTASQATMDGGTNGGGANAQGDGLYNVAQNNIRDNIVPPLDLGSHHDHSFGAHIASANEHHRVTGYLSTESGHVCEAATPGCADFCAEPDVLCGINDLQCTGKMLEETCSTHFRITGLMNTYSERLGGQRGTYQEIWVQLQYAMSLDNASVNGSPDVISSPFPYLHFMAYQVAAITVGCDTTNVDNGNTCNPFAHPGTHDFGWGG